MLWAGLASLGRLHGRGVNDHPNTFGYSFLGWEACSGCSEVRCSGGNVPVVFKGGDWLEVRIRVVTSWGLRWERKI